jgi:hypothetical protein
MIMRLVYSVFLLLAFFCAPVLSETPNGLTLQGRVISVRNVREVSRLVEVKIDLRLEFVNKGTAPIIMVRPWKDGGYWHGGSCLSTTLENFSANRCYFSDGKWASLSGSEADRKLADELDNSAPPQSSTRILKPGESWEWETTVNLRFDDNPRSYKVPWAEMKTLPSLLWLRVTFEMWPFNVELFKPDLAARLQKRWQRFGNMWIGERTGRRMHLARLSSEPIELDWRAAIAER